MGMTFLGGSGADAADDSISAPRIDPVAIPAPAAAPCHARFTPASLACHAPRLVWPLLEFVMAALSGIALRNGRRNGQTGSGMSEEGQT